MTPPCSATSLIQLQGICEEAATAAGATVARLMGHVVPGTHTQVSSIAAGDLDAWAASFMQGCAAQLHAIRGDLLGGLLVALPDDSAHAAAARALRAPASEPMTARLERIACAEILGAAGAAYLRVLTGTHRLDLDTERVARSDFGPLAGDVVHDLYLSDAGGPLHIRLALLVERRHPDTMDGGQVKASA